MAYVIGSDKGKEIAKNMTAGSTYTASDGSTWKKESDGSVTVTSKAGNVTQNAYPATSPSGGARPTSTVTSGGGTSTSGKNSPSTNVSYVPKGTYNDAGMTDSDKAKIREYKTQYDAAKAAGDVEAANAAHAAAQAIREQYGYSGGDDGSEYLELGMPEQEILEWVDFEEDNPRPTYTGKYDPEMEALLNQILNRDDFSYNAEKDPLYQQYANMYQREGDRAMRDTLSEAASSAGGMNSYAITAAQQAQNYYGSQLADKIPELYQLAYSMYLDDKESMVQDLGLLQSMDATQYNRYRDTMNDWKDDRSFAYGVYQDDVAQNNWQTSFDYNSMWDNRNFLNDNEWANKEWNANREQLDLENERYDREQAEEEVWNYIEMGVMPSDDLITRSGKTRAEVEALIAAAKVEKEANQKVVYVDDKKKKVDDDDDFRSGYTNLDDGEEITQSNFKNVANLKIGMISDDYVVQLYDFGLIDVAEDGTVKWKDGIDETNYMDHLTLRKPTFGLY